MRYSLTCLYIYTVFEEIFAKKTSDFCAEQVHVYVICIHVCLRVCMYFRVNWLCVS